MRKTKSSLRLKTKLLYVLIAHIRQTKIFHVLILYIGKTKNNSQFDSAYDKNKKYFIF